VIDEPVTTADLLEAWREATRAADLAERLAKLAAETSERADLSADASEEVAKLAEKPPSRPWPQRNVHDGQPRRRDRTHSADGK